MDNDKKELLYVMNLLKNKPQNEISKDYSNFRINKKFQFNIKPEAKFDQMVINDNFFNNLFVPSSKNETVYYKKANQRIISMETMIHYQQQRIH